MSDNGQSGAHIDPELTYTQELARVLQAQIRAASVAQERVCGKGQSLAFDRALKRGQEALVGMLRKACDELGPIEVSEEGRRFLESLEFCEIAAPPIVARAEVPPPALPELPRGKPKKVTPRSKTTVRARRRSSAAGKTRARDESIVRSAAASSESAPHKNSERGPLGNLRNA